MLKMSENKKIDTTLTTVLLAGVFAVGKKHKGFIPEAEMNLLKDSLERVKSASILHRGVSLLGTKTPGFAIKILDTFSHGLAYQYAERNRIFREQFSQMHSIYGSDLSIVNLRAGLDFIPDLYAYNNNLETINIDSEEILSQRKWLLQEKRPELFYNSKEVPLNLSLENDISKIQNFLKDKPTLVMAKGLFPYLEHDKVKLILQEIAKSPKPSMLTCSFLNSLNGNTKTKKEESTKQSMNYKSAWSPKDFTALATSLGMQVQFALKASTWMSEAIIKSGKINPQQLDETWDIENMATISNARHSYIPSIS